MNKGFTLVELLAVIVILLILVTILVPTVDNIIDKSKEVTHQTQINKILTSSYDYTLKHTEYLPDDNNVKYLTLGLLKSNGFIESDLKDPETRDLFSDNLVISIKNVGNNYEYNNPNSKLSGKYLYTVEIEKLNDLSENIPTIELIGANPTSKSDTFVQLIDLASEYTELSYSAKSYDNKDITSSVIKLIYKNDNFVDSIDTSESGLYKIKYIAIDEKGNSKVVTLNVIIEDKISPEIILPENSIISTEVDTYDLMAGVSCTDNSEICNIEYSGNITFHTPGSYVITYTAIDPAGNTKEVKRIIRVKYV